jgi:hypothetical protein
VRACVRVCCRGCVRACACVRACVRMYARARSGDEQAALRTVPAVPFGYHDRRTTTCVGRIHPPHEMKSSTASPLAGWLAPAPRARRHRVTHSITRKTRSEPARASESTRRTVLVCVLQHIRARCLLFYPPLHLRTCVRGCVRACVRLHPHLSRSVCSRSVCLWTDVCSCS